MRKPVVAAIITSPTVTLLLAAAPAHNALAAEPYAAVKAAAIHDDPPVSAQPQRQYTVVTGDTLSGIAAKLGLNGSRRLYQINRRVIGSNPNRIKPGEVLNIPANAPRPVSNV